jgi:Cu-processing system permease protein
MNQAKKNYPKQFITCSAKMIKVAKYVVVDILRNRILIAYTLLLFTAGFGFFMFNDDYPKAISSLLTLVLVIVPLISLVFTTTYFFNSYEFIELLVSQPLKRSNIILGQYAGMSVSFLLSFFTGIGIPVLLFSMNAVGLVLLLTGFLLTLVFISLAFLAAVVTRDKAKGIGLALLLWFFFSIIYDGIVLVILFSFSDYPLERIMLIITALNPIDLSRILVLLKMDISALMGYTGAVFQDFFGTSSGMFFAIILLVVWAVWPIWLTVKVFDKKNL